MTNFAEPGSYPVDGRGVTLFDGVFQRQASGRPGQFYLMTIRDKDGKPLDGGGDLSAERAGERAGQAVLVGDGL